LPGVATLQAKQQCWQKSNTTAKTWCRKCNIAHYWVGTMHGRWDEDENFKFQQNR